MTKLPFPFSDHEDIYFEGQMSTCMKRKYGSNLTCSIKQEAIPIISEKLLDKA
jgi:hypothetical protein